MINGTDAGGETNDVSWKRLALSGRKTGEAADRPPAGAAKPVDQRTVAQYFKDAPRSEVAGDARLSRTAALARTLTGVAGVVLVGLTAYEIWRHFATLWVWPIPRIIDRTPLWLGLVLLAAALPKTLWQLGFGAPAAVVAGAALAELTIFRFIDRQPALLVLFLAGALAAATLRRTLRDQQIAPPLPILEPNLDAWTDALIRRLVLAEGLPLDAGLRPDDWRILRTLPVLDGNGPALLYRIGRDHHPRLTPAGVAAILIQPGSVIVIEAIVDLIEARLVTRRLREIRSSAITALDLSMHQTSAEPSPVTPATSPAGRARMTRRKAQAEAGSSRQRDEMVIHLAGCGAITLVFRDTALIPATGPDGIAVAELNPPKHIRELWQALLGSEQRQ